MKIKLLKDSANDLKELIDFLNYHDRRNYVPSGGRVFYKGNLLLDNMCIESLPASIGRLDVERSLVLENNYLRELPESFGEMRIGADLYLGNNQLEKIPDSFVKLKIPGRLGLSNNLLRSLPKGFGDMKIGGWINLFFNNFKSFPEEVLKFPDNQILIDDKWKAERTMRREQEAALAEWEADDKIEDEESGLKELLDFLDKYEKRFGRTGEARRYHIEGDRIVYDGNIQFGDGMFTAFPDLQELPREFGRLIIKGRLWAPANHLRELPESFGNLIIENELILTSGVLERLPEGFGNIQVGGGVDLAHNCLVDLPESFGNLKYGGYVNLRDNPLISLPTSILKINPEELLLSKEAEEIYNALKEWEHES